MKILDLKEELNNCFMAENGIYYYDKNENISYPEDGNEECFRIEENSFWFKHRNDCIKILIEKYGDNKEIFDIGGGNGFTTLMLQNIGKRVILIEPGKKGVENAKKRGIKEIVCAVFKREIFKKQISNATSFDVIEHIDNDLVFVKEVYETLVENGKFYVTVPAYKFLWSNEDVDAGHFRRYKIKEIEEILIKVGFKIKYKGYIFSFLVFPLFILRTIPSILRIRKKGKNKNSEKEHKAGVFFGIVLKLLCNWEKNRILKGKKILFGTSCILVGVKEENN